MFFFFVPNKLHWCDGSIRLPVNELWWGFIPLPPCGKKPQTQGLWQISQCVNTKHVDTSLIAYGFAVLQGVKSCFGTNLHDVCVSAFQSIMWSSPQQKLRGKLKLPLKALLILNENVTKFSKGCKKLLKSTDIKCFFNLRSEITSEKAKACF